MECFKIIYDTSNILKKDKERIFKDYNNSNKIKIYIEKLALNFPEISNIKRLQPKSECKFMFRKWEYRIVFWVDYWNKIIIIYRIWLRKDIYED